MRFSNRTAFGGTEPNPLALRLEKARRDGVRLLDLTESNPARCAFRSLAGILAPLSDAANRRYEPDPRGLLRARESVCAYYASLGAQVHPDRVFLTSGTSEAYSHLFHLLSDEGGRVLCKAPAYPLVDHLAAYAGVRVERFGARGPSGKAAALILVNPANPTGAYVSEAEWKSLEAFCAGQDGALISDEVFFDFDWGTSPKATGAARDEGLHFTLGGISKLLGLPQMKLAWTVLSGPERTVKEALARLEAVCDAFLSVNTASQNALPYWFGHKDAFVREVLERVKANHARLLERGLDAVTPQGGWYTPVRLPEGLDDERAALELLDKHGVHVQPGYFFDLEDGCLIVSLLPEPALFDEAASALARGLAALC